MKIRFIINPEAEADGFADKETVTVNLAGTGDCIELIVSLIMHEELECLIQQEISEGWWEAVIEEDILDYLGRLVL